MSNIKTKQYRIAIVIPVLNEESFIERCLNSVLNQNFLMDDVEIVIVDGGSSDHTLHIVRGKYGHYDNITMLNNPKKNQAAAFNLGVYHTSAPLIIRMDAHCEYDKEYIAIIEKYIMSDSTIGNVGGKVITLPSVSGLMAATIAILNQSKFGIGGAAFRVSNCAQTVDTVPFGAFPRKVLLKVGLMNEVLFRGEDNDFNRRILKADYKIFFDPAIKCNYFARSTLFSCVKQMFANGESIGLLVRESPDSIALRHIIPSLFVASLFGSLLLVVVNALFIYGFLLIVGMYLFANVVSSIQEGKKHGIKFVPYLSALFLLSHSSYGIGTIFGLIKYVIFKK